MLDCLNEYQELTFRQRGFWSPVYEVLAPGGRRVLACRQGGSLLARDIRISSGTVPGTELLRVQRRLPGVRCEAFGVTDAAEGSLIGAVSRMIQGVQQKWECRLPEGGLVASLLEDSLAGMRLLFSHPAERRYAIFGADGDLLGQVEQRFAPYSSETVLRFYNADSPAYCDRRLLFAAAMLIAIHEHAPGSTA